MGEIVVVPVAFAATMFNTEALTNIMVKARDRESVPGVISRLTKRLTEQHYGKQDFVTITQDAVLSVFDGIFNAITAALGGIAGISLIVAGVLIMNVMLVAVSQRTASEIGLYMAIGGGGGGAAPPPDHAAVYRRGRPPFGGGDRVRAGTGLPADLVRAATVPGD